MIRAKQSSPVQQGFADDRAGVECPFPEGSYDAQEWEIGWMRARMNNGPAQQAVTIGGTALEGATKECDIEI